MFYYFHFFFFFLLPFSRPRERGETVVSSIHQHHLYINDLTLMRPVAAARAAARAAATASSSSSTSSVGWAASQRCCAAVAALHSSSSALAPPRRQQQQQQRRGLPQPARAGARDAAMRELMATRDDARADSLQSKAPLGERCF